MGIAGRSSSVGSAFFDSANIGSVLFNIDPSELHLTTREGVSFIVYFEGMREMLSTAAAPPHYLWCAFIRNILYMTATSFLFRYFLDEAMKLGFLAKYAA